MTKPYTAKRNNPSPLMRRGALHEQIKYFLAFFIFFALQFLMRSNLSSSPSAYSYSYPFYVYLLNYSLGSGSRMLIGTLIKPFYDDFLDYRTIYIFVIVWLVLLWLMISYILSGVIARSRGNLKYGITAAVLMLVSSPVSIYYLDNVHFGKLDLYILIFTLAALGCLRHPKLFWLIPLLCLAATATHQIFIPLYMPLIGIVLLYEVFRHMSEKKYLVLFCATCTVTVLAFVFFQFIARALPFSVSFANAEEMAEYIRAHSPLEPLTEALFTEYFLPLFPPDWIGPYMSVVSDFALKYLILAFVSFLPFIIFLPTFWVMCIRRAKSGLGKLIFAMCLCSPVPAVIFCVVATDWDRFFAAAVLAQFLLIFFFALAGDKTVRGNLGRFGGLFVKSPWLWLIVCAWAVLMLSTVPYRLYSMIDYSAYKERFSVLMNK